MIKSNFNNLTNATGKDLVDYINPNDRNLLVGVAHKFTHNNNTFIVEVNRGDDKLYIDNINVPLSESLSNVKNLVDTLIKGSEEQGYSPYIWERTIVDSHIVTVRQTYKPGKSFTERGQLV